MKTAQLILDKAVVTNVFNSEKGNQYVTMASPAGEYKFMCPSGVHDFEQYLEADRQTYTLHVSGQIFENRLSLTVHKVVSAGNKPKGQ